MKGVLGSARNLGKGFSNFLYLSHGFETKVTNKVLQKNTTEGYSLSFKLQKKWKFQEKKIIPVIV